MNFTIILLLVWVNVNKQNVNVSKQLKKSQLVSKLLKRGF